jgi:hypothetical protein
MKNWSYEANEKFNQDLKDSILFNQDGSFKDVTEYNEDEWEDFFNE